MFSLYVANVVCVPALFAVIVLLGFCLFDRLLENVNFITAIFDKPVAVTASTNRTVDKVDVREPYRIERILLGVAIANGICATITYSGFSP